MRTICVTARRCPFFEKFEKFKSFFRKISKKIEKIEKFKSFFQKVTMESNFGLLLCPKSIKNGQIITVLAKTVHFGMCYCNKLQLNLRKNYNFFRIF
jgi:hypothetical protein